MQLQTEDFPFTLLTPCFSGTALGKLDDHAEMRVPPIRGHVRFWHRQLFSAADANRVWGCTNGNEGNASRVAIRFVGDVSKKHSQPRAELLPHKENPNHRGPRPALCDGERFAIQVQRLVGCSNDDLDHAQRAVKLWLVLGCLGLRSNRAAGSVWPLNNWVPVCPDSLKTTIKNLGLSGWSVALVGLGQGKTEDELRETASDTIAGTPHRPVFGGINDREPSPTKFKVVMIQQTGQTPAPCLLAVAPCRQIQGHGGIRRTVLQEAEHLLRNVKPNRTRWLSLGNWNHILP